MPHQSRIALCALLGITALCAASVLLLPRTLLVSIRTLLFADFATDSELVSIAVDGLPSRKTPNTDTPAGLAAYVNPATFESLRDFASRHPHDDTLLAREIMFQISSGRAVDKCNAGLPLATEIALVAEQHGCCSDYMRAYIAYGEAIGFPVREADNVRHSSVEYLDRDQGRWIWIDPSLRRQAQDSHSRLLSHLEIRTALLRRETVDFIDLTGDDADRHAPFDVSVYQPAAYEAIYWRARNSLVASESIDKRLRALRLPLAARQFIEFGLGVQPRYLGLADARFVRVHRIARVLLIVLLATVTLAWLISLSVAGYAAAIGLKRGWRLARPRILSAPGAVDAAHAVTPESENSLSGQQSSS